MTNKVYDVLKFLAQIFLPALGTLYFTIAGIWNLPAAEQVVGTIVAIDAFLGALLSLAKRGYDKDVVMAGNMVVHHLESGGKNFSLELDHEPEELEDKREVRFEVQQRKHTVNRQKE